MTLDTSKRFRFIEIRQSMCRGQSVRRKPVRFHDSSLNDFIEDWKPEKKDETSKTGNVQWNHNSRKFKFLKSELLEYEKILHQYQGKHQQLVNMKDYDGQKLLEMFLHHVRNGFFFLIWDIFKEDKILNKVPDMIKPLKRVDRLVFHNSSSQSSIQEADFTASVSRVTKKDYENSKSSLFVTPESSQIITE